MNVIFYELSLKGMLWEMFPFIPILTCYSDGCRNTYLRWCLMARALRLMSPRSVGRLVGFQ